MAQAAAEQGRQEAGTGLGATIEQGIAATDIGAEAMELSHAITQVDNVRFARATTVFVIRTL